MLRLITLCFIPILLMADVECVEKITDKGANIFFIVECDNGFNYKALIKKKGNKLLESSIEKNLKKQKKENR